MRVRISVAGTAPVASAPCNITDCVAPSSRSQRSETGSLGGGGGFGTYDAGSSPGPLGGVDGGMGSGGGGGEPSIEATHETDRSLPSCITWRSPPALGSTSAFRLSSSASTLAPKPAPLAPPARPHATRDADVFRSDAVAPSAARTVIVTSVAPAVVAEAAVDQRSSWWLAGSSGCSAVTSVVRSATVLTLEGLIASV